MLEFAGGSEGLRFGEFEFNIGALIMITELIIIIITIITIIITIIIIGIGLGGMVYYT